MASVFVTGASRGIGLEFCRQYAEDGWRVFATCRDPEGAPDLARLAARHRQVSVHPLDVSDAAAIRALPQALGGEPLDLLINNAGMSGGPAGELGSFDAEGWTRVLRVNTLAPLLVAEALLDSLERGQGRTIVNLTSRMGSIGENGSGGYYAYRSSKAALNAAMKSLAIGLRAKNFTVVVVHPGWVRTDMGGASAPLAPSDSVGGLRQLIDRLRPGDSGRFLDRDGTELPW